MEAPQVTAWSDPEWRAKFFHLALRRGRKIAKLAMARRLAVRLYLMWRQQWDYEQLKKFGPHAANPEQALLCLFGSLVLIFGVLQVAQSGESIGMKSSIS